MNGPQRIYDYSRRRAKSYYENPVSKTIKGGISWLSPCSILLKSISLEQLETLISTRIA